MADVPKAPDAKKDPIELARRWLSRAGFPLEMRVAGTFRRRGFHVVQSDFYKTPDGVYREIDVHASRGEMWLPGKHGDAYFSMSNVVECKGKPDVPWIVFSSDIDQAYARVASGMRPGSRRGRDLMTIAEIAEGTGQLPFFKVRRRVGHSVTAAESGSQDEAYKAMSGLADACKALSAAADAAWDAFVVYLPLVVINAPLIECYEGRKGAMELRERNHVPVFWSRSVFEDDPYFVIDVVTEAGLSAYVGRVRALYDAVNGIYRDPAIREQRLASDPK